MLCGKPSFASSAFLGHLHRDHKGEIQDGQIESLEKLANRPAQHISTSACPFCDCLKDFSDTRKSTSKSHVSLAHFRRHVAQHLEQIALFALPQSNSLEPVSNRSVPDHYSDDDDELSDEALEAVADVAEQVQIDSDTSEDILAMMFPESGNSLLSPPNLALGWQPPHDFTPPRYDFAVSDAELIPQREESLFGGDLFSPGWVRGIGKAKEGYCARCAKGHWVNIPSGKYEFHLTYLHGVPKTGLPLPRPSIIREIREQIGAWEGYCDQCCGWRALKKTNQGWNWYRHYLMVGVMIN